MAPELAALEDFAKKSKVLRRLIDTHGPAHLARPLPVATRFGSLVRAILYQQLAGNAALAIHTRLIKSLTTEVTATRALKLGQEKMRLCGLSGAKAGAILDLARHVDDGQIPLERLGWKKQDEIVSMLCRVRGIGVWTAEMFCMNAMGRLDVWPTLDYGVRVGYASAWKLKELPTPKSLAPLADPFRPYRSAIAWYCWREADAKKARAKA